MGKIVETEAYRGEEDLACHASKGKTPRTAVMYGTPGLAYVYLIYGMYHMLNVVVWPEGIPAAVLIRGIEPVTGVEGSTDGPGKLSRAFEIDGTFNGEDLTREQLYIIPGQLPTLPDIVSQERVGVDYAGEWAHRPWHFSIRGNEFVSRVRRTT
jgi:DNA-3-methyladenine glycosylase